MRILFYGNRQVGAVGLLTAMALGHRLTQVWEDEGYGMLGVPSVLGVEAWILRRGEQDYPPLEGEPELLLCVHGRRVIPPSLLERFPKGGVNLHPFLDKHPGARYVSVYAHRMTEAVDQEEILALVVGLMPEFEDDEAIGIQEQLMYNKLYPRYVQAIAIALGRLA